MCMVESNDVNPRAADICATTSSSVKAKIHFQSIDEDDSGTITHSRRDKALGIYCLSYSLNKQWHY